jgi:phosphoribosyl 1,2-cyclic phosphodiesterase
MKLSFLGTRGYIKAHNRHHNRHSSLLVSYGRRRLLVDCGEDWINLIGGIRANAIIVTHAHPDHAGGLRQGAACPVYATSDAWKTMDNYQIKDRRTVRTREPFALDGIKIEAFPVVHSLLAPAVGYRITAGRIAIFYVPDVIDIEDKEQALAGVRLFIGDGASISRPLVRRHGSELFGHTTVRAQLGWCQEAGIKRAIFTHCGSEIVEHDERVTVRKLREMGSERGVDARLAHDGLEIVLR